MFKAVQRVDIGKGAGDNDIHMRSLADHDHVVFAQAHGHLSLRVCAAGN